LLLPVPNNRRPEQGQGAEVIVNKNLLERHRVRVSGHGHRALLFAHGLGFDQRAWRRVAPAFEATHRVVVFDHAGCSAEAAQSYDETRHGSLHGYAQDLLDICDALGLERVSVVGHSVGGMISLLASLAQPERFERLVLLTASPCYMNLPGYDGGFDRADLEGVLDMMERSMLGWAQFMAPMALNDPTQPQLLREVESSFAGSDPYTTQRLARLVFLGDHRALMPQVRAPALVVQCTGDVVVPVNVGHWLHGQLHGSALALLETAGHCPQLSQAQRTIGLISDYLNG
jgi:sigma-B regulation protein RsbQ